MARELAATRRVRKGLLPGVGTGESRSAQADGSAGQPSANGEHPVGERVVADVRHEIGNYFHKLYYWADFLSESRVGRPGDVTATQMLEDTIRSLEELVRTTLEYVRPIEVSPIRMGAREVVDGVLRQLAAAGDWQDVTTDDRAALGDRGIVVDPGRLSQLLGFIGRRLASLGTMTLAMDVTVVGRADGDVVALRATATSTSCDPAPTILTEVEWATAENLARALGGELVHDGAPSRPTLVLALPLRA